MVTLFQVRWLAVGVVLGMAAIAAPLATAQPPAVNKEDLRYDGKTFAYWQTYLHTELKAELRVEALRALGAFGANGYAEEAAVTVLEVMKIDQDNRIVVAAQEALQTIGAPVVPRILVSNLSDPQIAAAARHLLWWPGKLRIGASEVATLVLWSQDKDRDVAFWAVRILGSQVDKGIMEAALQCAVAKDGDARKFAVALVQVWKEHPSEYDAPGTLLNRLGSADEVVTLLVQWLKELAPERQKLSASPYPSAGGTTVYVVNQLAKMGRAAKGAIPVLRDPDLAQAPCGSLREAVANAIAKIDRPRRALNVTPGNFAAGG
jgi:hypothetical protein